MAQCASAMRAHSVYFSMRNIHTALVTACMQLMSLLRGVTKTEEAIRLMQAACEARNLGGSGGVPPQDFSDSVRLILRPFQCFLQQAPVATFAIVF